MIRKQADPGSGYCSIYTLREARLRGCDALADQCSFQIAVVGIKMAKHWHK